MDCLSAIFIRCLKLLVREDGQTGGVAKLGSEHGRGVAFFVLGVQMGFEISENFGQIAYGSDVNRLAIQTILLCCQLGKPGMFVHSFFEN